MTANLLSRLQGLSAPDTRIDAEIYASLGSAPHTATAGGRTIPLIEKGDPNSWPAYTASLDAAVALCERVLPGWKKQFFESFKGLWIARVTSPRHETHSTDYMRGIPPGGSPNGAIALLIAILTALEAREK